MTMMNAVFDTSERIKYLVIDIRGLSVETVTHFLQWNPGQHKGESVAGCGAKWVRYDSVLLSHGWARFSNELVMKFGLVGAG